MKRFRIQILVVALLVLCLNGYSQTTNDFTGTFPCTCSVPIDYNVEPWQNIQNYLKRKGVNCRFEENGIESLNFVELERSENILLRIKISVLCTQNGLKVQMTFQEGRSGSSHWTEDNQLTSAGKRFAKVNYEKWKSEIIEILCTQ